MFAGLYAKLIGAGLVLALIGGAALYMHHMGAVSQKAADGKVIAAYKIQQQLYEVALQNDATVMLRINQDAAKAKSYAALQRTYADAALQQLHADEQSRAANDAAWQAKLADAVKSKGCQAQLSANLCAAVPNY